MPWKLASLGTLFALSVLAGCSTSESSAAKEPAKDSGAQITYDRCEAKGADFTIGQTASAALLQQARTRSGAQSARVLGPNDMVTLEYRSDRLNLNTDSSGKIIRANCG
ncbi:MULTISPECIES: I78 family peptidase inhibitor [Pseudomonas]|uniref:Peptidase inhibitor I78 family protein n=1 Tax=Pseudomonas gingeri TaxID=117681 RepID=A0A7Y7WIU4_9PSED|nr:MULTISPECIES: I78 family peptidase inhibitor [Pseudomonas]MCU1736360.1 I78 family peptidase inhibitor [Pseudomonas sp. 20S_6.2_Bac1]NWB50162.1 hypothetical protein [Pseudomonas gingeri]